MLISSLSSFQSLGLAGSILQDLPGGSRGAFVSPARNTVLGKWQELLESFLISTVVSLALDCLFANSWGEFPAQSSQLATQMVKWVHVNDLSKRHNLEIIFALA